MDVICLDNHNTGHCLTKNKKYSIIKTRRWNNGYVQYLIQNDKGDECWFSIKRFSNRKEKLIEINKVSDTVKT